MKAERHNMSRGPAAARTLTALVLLAASPCPAAGDSLVSTSSYAAAYGGTKQAVTVDAARELPRYPPVEPKDAPGTWQVKNGFQMQLAAHEPQICDPIALCFDERGRMFVCEMIDYSEMRDTRPHLGRVSLLEDRDRDGRFETSTVFADDLPWPTGLIWAHGGLYVGATPDIWRLEDRDGDGKAEVRQKIFTGFGTGLKVLNVQGLLNSFQWGQDNRIHVLAGGGNRGLITCPKRPDLPAQELGGRDFWFDPVDHAFGLENGGAQYGMSFDDYGRKFGCSNSDHLQYWVYDAAAAAANPLLPLPPARQSIAADGGAAEVFRISPDEPWRIVRTRWRIAGTVPGVVEGGGRVSGYFTGATGTTIYRGDAYGPSFVNNSFTGDAGGQLVHRKVIRPADDGVNLTGERPADERGFEFAASRDTWVRVVGFANAPDGCLYVCDMYREVIEHPWSIPDELKKHLDLNSGHDRGRIWRIAPAGWRQPKDDLRCGRLAGAGTPELVRLLEHPNGWHRDTAQRMLYERRDPAAIPLLEQVASGGRAMPRLHALGLLDGLHALRDEVLLGALDDGQAPVRERALLLLAGRHPHGTTNTRINGKLAALAADPAPRVRFQLALVLGAMLAGKDTPALRESFVRLAKTDHAHPWIGPALLAAAPAVVAGTLFEPMTRDAALARQASPFVAKLVELRAATAPASDREALIALVAQGHVNPLWLRALGDGLRRAGTTITAADAGRRLAPVFAKAAMDSSDARVEPAVRAAAIDLLGLAPPEVSRAALAACLAAGQPDAVQVAAVGTLARDTSSAATRLLLAHWPDYAAAAREAVLHALLSRQDRMAPLLEAVQSGAVPAAALSAAQVQTLVQHKDASIVRRARAALASVIPPSRAEVTARFREAAATRGDAARGQVQYQQRCLACHRADGQGLQVGPDLVTVKTRGRDALLTAILEPSKEVAAQYIVFHFTTRDGAAYAGFIAEDNATGVTLKMPGGLTQTLPRALIKGSSSTGQSLMPEGLEAGMTVQDMADLLTFIEELR